MTTPTNAERAASVLLACDLAVRLNLESAAKRIRNRRGRSQRGQYDGIPDADLYLVLDPAPSSSEMDECLNVFHRWWGLPSVLEAHQVDNLTLYVSACREYVRAAMLSQTRHDPATLAAYLAQADAVAAG